MPSTVLDVICILPTRFENHNNLHYKIFEKDGTSLAGQCLGLLAFTAKDLGSVPGWGTKILHAVQCSKKKKIFFLIEK